MSLPRHVLLKGGNGDAFTDLGARADEREADCDNPLSLTLPMPIPNCPSFCLSSRQPFHTSLSTLYPPLSKRTQPAYLAIPYYLFLFTNPVQHALNTLTTTAPGPY
jgi:hypothetical protein